MALIIDVETTGLPTKHNANNIRIVQITMMLCNENYEKIKLDDFIIRATDFQIPSFSTSIHGITDEISRKRGVSFSSVSKIIQDYLNQSSCIIAHNINFDVSMLIYELERLGKSSLSIIEEINKKKQLCSMKYTKELVNLRDARGSMKSPKLAELYLFVFGKEINNAHNSMYDVLNLHAIVKELYDSRRLPVDFMMNSDSICGLNSDSICGSICHSNLETIEPIETIDEPTTNYTLPTISQEQETILNELLINNVLVDSVAGSGKTTCNLHIASRFKDKRILLLTYNARLKIETRQKAGLLGIQNLEIHSYHSFCVKYYDKRCFDDSIIKNIVKNKTIPKQSKGGDNYDLIVLDEAQDITSLYYELICKIYRENKTKNPIPKLCIFGDKNQAIFDFNNADQRFMEYAPEIFKFNNFDWVKCNLSQSFRVTSEMARFINQCMLKRERLVSNKIQNMKPRYIICDCFDSRPFQEFKRYLRMGYGPSEIFILAPSLKNIHSPVVLLENEIKRSYPEIMIHVPINDDEKIDENLLKGKLIFSTFHQTKGLERKVVIVFNFDNSYFKYFKTDSNPYICPNEMYVATTRGKEQLTLFHHFENDYLPFIDKKELDKCCHLETSMINIKTSNKSMDITVCNLIKYQPQHVIEYCFNLLKIKENEDYRHNRIVIPSIVSDPLAKSCESVIELTGIAIPAFFEIKLKNTMTILKQLKDSDFDIEVHDKRYNINDINIEKITPQELLYVSNCWNTLTNGYVHKLHQIVDYHWLDQDMLDESMERLATLNISDDALFKVGINVDKNPELLGHNLIGTLDCIDETETTHNVYKFKSSKIKKECHVELALYAYLYEMKKKREQQDHKVQKYILYNILTNENYEIQFEFHNLQEIVRCLMNSKFIKKRITDEEFIEKHLLLLKHNSIIQTTLDKFWLK